MTDSPDQTLALARTAAGAVRSLNHATLGGEGLAQPADAYELIGELAGEVAGGAELSCGVLTNVIGELRDDPPAPSSYS